MTTLTDTSQLQMPQTLWAMAGRPPSPAAWNRSCVVVIDCQREYETGRLRLPDGSAALQEIAMILGEARRNRVPVFHIVQCGTSGGLFDPDGPGYPICSPVSPHDGEPVIAKTLPNSFAGTPLLDHLKTTAPDATGKLRDTLIVMGFMTHNCVSSTVRAALDLGFTCSLIASACATRPLPDPLHPGQSLDAARINRVVLAGLADRHGVVMDTAQEFLAAMASADSLTETPSMMPTR